MTDGPRSAVSLITRGPFARLWWTSLVSSTGDWIVIFATIALGDEIAGGQGILVAVIARILPGLVFGAAVGVVTDRFDRRLLIVVADLGRALVVPALLFATTLPSLVIISLILEFFSLLGQSPRAAIVPRLVSRENIVTANSLILAAAYATIPLGAAFNWFLASLPTVTLGEIVPDTTAPFALAFLVDSATFLVSGFVMATLPALRPESVEAARNGDGDVDSEEGRSTWQDLEDGGRYVWHHKSVRRVIASLTAALFGGGVVIALGPSFVEDVLDAGNTGFFAVVTALGLGAAVGIVVVSLYGDRWSRRDVVFGVATFTTGLGLSAAALTSTVFGASSWIFVMGVGAGAAYVMGLSHLHEVVADDMQGRVFAMLFTLMRVALFVSMLIAIPLEGTLSQFDLWALFEPASRPVLFLGGAVIMATGLTTLWSLRHLVRRPKIGKETQHVLDAASKAIWPGRREK
jgi:dTMP kinase